MLRKMGPNKTRKTGDDATVVVPLAEGMQLLELSALQLCMDRETCDMTWMKQTTMHSTIL